MRSAGQKGSLAPKRRRDEKPRGHGTTVPAARHGSKRESWPRGEGRPTAPRASAERGRGAQACPDPAGPPKGCLRRKFWQAPAQGGCQGCTRPGQPSRRTPPPTSPCGSALSVRLFHHMYHKRGIRWPGDVTHPLLFKDKHRRLLVRRSPR